MEICNKLLTFAGDDDSGVLFAPDERLWRGVCSEVCRTWVAELFPCLGLPAVQGWVKPGVFGGGDVGAWRPDMRRVCLISVYWLLLRRLFVRLVRTGWEFHLCAAAGMKFEPPGVG